MSRDALESSNATTFDGWAEAGRGESMADGHAELVEAALDFLALEPGQSVLDVGCGVGKALASARARGAGRLFGVDVAPAMVARAAERLTEADVQVASGEALPWADDSVDHTLSIESLYYHHDPVASLKEVARVVRSGGRFSTVIELYGDNPGAHAWLEAMPMEMRCWSTERWLDALRAAGFRDVAADRVVRSTGFKAEADFQPSAFFPTYAAYLTFRKEGALRLMATVR